MKKIFTKIFIFALLIGSFSFSSANINQSCFNNSYSLNYKSKIEQLFTKIDNKLQNKTDDEKINFYTKINQLIENYYIKLSKKPENIKIIRILQSIECISENKIAILENKVDNIFNDINNLVEKNNYKNNLVEKNNYKNNKILDIKLTNPYKYK
jgi:hypothetical protein